MAVITNLMVNGTNYSISDASAVPQMRTVNNKSLTTDIVLDYSDIGQFALKMNRDHSVVFEIQVLHFGPFCLL